MRGGATCLHGPRVCRAVAPPAAAAAICRCLHYPHWSQLQQLRSLTQYSEMMLPLWRSSQSGDPGSTNTRAGSLHIAGVSILTGRHAGCRHLPSPAADRGGWRKYYFYPGAVSSLHPQSGGTIHCRLIFALLTPAAPLCYPHRVLLLPAISVLGAF